MRLRTLRVVTTNPGKLREFRTAFDLLGISVRQVDREYPEIQADDFEAVARAGVEWLRDRGQRDFVLEDAGLRVDALGGFPGVYSKFVFQTIGCDGILRLMRGRRDRSASFVSVIAGELGGKRILVRGECAGSLSHRARGGLGFGFDPIFVPRGERRTFAQMAVKEKNVVSHRGVALAKLAVRLRQAKK
ncbi:MAG TPA: RdgB/HAM1 family non-canonical purine NTP pyrophosphatase [Thermoplasmata archaeon]|nr:RdgB/HAM1 family non-canonical purine NTP pyrophosphatase [Thermoplasmata archaeon]